MAKSKSKKATPVAEHGVNLGYFPDEKAERDAVHVAVIPLYAGERLSRGSKVKLKYGSVKVAMCAEYNEKDAIGIVDPFLKDYEVPENGRFWCMLFPGSVTGMRHHWAHPSFEEDKVPKAKTVHEEWIRDFCDRWNFNYDELINAATSRIPNDWRYVTAHGHDLHSRAELGEDHDLFWEHLQELMGDIYDEAHREGMGWSCTC